MPEESVVVARRYCRICTSQCGILVDVAAGEVVRVRGDRTAVRLVGARRARRQRVRPPLVAQLATLRPPGPLCLVPRRQKRHVNSQLTFLGDAPEVLLHPDDAAAAGLADGQAVIVRSGTGELSGTARVDPGMRRGAVSVPHGYEGANVNMLTSHQEADPVTGMARYSGVPVTVHAAG